jgi:hypothetical protein
MFDMTNQNRGIVVLGMHRSGTSLIAHMVHLWGAYAEAEMLMPGDVYNPLGYWEPAPLVRLNDELLAMVQSRWRVPPGSNARLSLAAMAQEGDFRKRALDLLTANGADQPWFWKDPRLSILLPFWKQLWGRVLYIVAVREPGDIADSLRHRDGMSATAALLLWHKYMADILADEDVRSTGVFFAYESILTDPKCQCDRLCRLLDERFGSHPADSEDRVERMASAVEAKLWRNRGRTSLLWSSHATEVQRKLQNTLLLRSTGEQAISSEDFPMQPGWRRILAREEDRRTMGAATAQCRVYWRDSHSEYSEARAAFVFVTLDGTPQFIEIAIPRLENGGAVGIRIDLTDRPAALVLTAMEVRDSKRNIIWAWDGRANSITALSHNEIASCTPLQGETGCTLQLPGFDPWIEIALEAERAAATVDGAFVLLRCTYSSSVEYLLFAYSAQTSRAMSRLQHLEADHSGLRQEAMSRLQHLEAEQAGLRQEAMSRLERLEVEQARLHQEAISRLERLEVEQAGLRQEAMSRLERLEAEQAGLRQEAISRLQHLEAEQAGLHRTIQELLNSRTWKMLVALGGAVLRLRLIGSDSGSRKLQ